MPLLDFHWQFSASACKHASHSFSGFGYGSLCLHNHLLMRMLHLPHLFIRSERDWALKQVSENEKEIETLQAQKLDIDTINRDRDDLEEVCVVLV